MSYAATLSAGTSGNPRNRTMRSGAATLEYGLYLDPWYLLPWGTGVGGTLPLVSSLLLLQADRETDATHVIYGRIPAGQSVPSGDFVDTVTVTVVF